MFHSNNFSYTRGVDTRANLPVEDYEDQFGEELGLYNDTDEHQRNTLSDFGPDPIHLEQDQPRRDNFSRWKLNLRHHGAYDPTLPYSDGSLDIQFHDRDARGCAGNHDWRAIHANDRNRQQLQLWGRDADHSVPESGLAAVDMLSRLTQIRRDLRGRIAWFSESLGITTTGRGQTGNISVAHNAELGNLGVLESVDPTANEYQSRQTPNRIFSNNANLGGKFFNATTTTDHVLPVSSYAHVFKTAAPRSPRAMSEMIVKDSKVHSLSINDVPKKFVDFLEQRTSVHPDILKNKTESTQKFGRLWATQTNKAMPDTTREILSLIGITTTDLQYARSKVASNGTATDPVARHILDMVETIDALPPNARMNFRNTLLASELPNFVGGVSSTDMNVAVKDILKSRPATATKTETRRLQAEHQIQVSKLVSEGKLYTRAGASQATRRLGSDVETHVYNFAELPTRCRVTNYVRPQTGETTQFATESLKDLIKNRTTNYKQVETDHDTTFGREHQYQYEATPLTESLTYKYR